MGSLVWLLASSSKEENMARPRLVACVFAAFVLLGACAQDEPTTPEAEPTAEASPTAQASPAGAGSEAATVAVADNPDHGEILTNAQGLTLYLFENDTGGTSTCTGDCAKTWPPLTTDGEPTAGEGADESLLGTTDRDDDTTQVTYDDQPLYTYSGDEEAGDTNGQGIGDRWYVVTPDGEAMKS
jgi:predicted lipoprotein with Yx(FWY)xxD motif